MVRTYQRKSRRQSWTSESMQMAIDAYNNGVFGFKKAAEYYGVPKSTLFDMVKGKISHVAGNR